MSNKQLNNKVPPDEWYQFVTVAGGKRVRVELTKAFEEVLGSLIDEVIDELEAIGHFSAHDIESWPKKRVSRLKAKIARVFESRTGISLNGVLNKADELENQFNASDNPLQTATSSGLTRLYRKHKE
jgi:hypothetical protein